MSKVLIVYGSTTGNTEALAEILGRLIQEAGHETALINAKGHKVACFATGDSNFTYFCGAVDVIEAALERLGADVVVEGLKIDGQAQSDQPEIQEWTKAVIETL